MTLTLHKVKVKRCPGSWTSPVWSTGRCKSSLHFRCEGLCLVWTTWNPPSFRPVHTQLQTRALFKKKKKNYRKVRVFSFCFRFILFSVKLIWKLFQHSFQKNGKHSYFAVEKQATLSISSCTVAYLVLMFLGESVKQKTAITSGWLQIWCPVYVDLDW